MRAREYVSAKMKVTESFPPELMCQNGTDKRTDCPTVAYIGPKRWCPSDRQTDTIIP